MLSEIINLNLFAFLLILARVGTTIAVLPGFAAAYVSPRIRLAIILVVSFLLTPTLAASLPGPPSSPWNLLLLIGGEMLVGFFLGLMATVLLASLQTAGTMISLFSSMANALIRDPIAEQQSSIIAGLLTAAGILMVFISDTHHLMFRVMADSYTLFVPGQGIIVGDMSEMLAHRVSESFAMGFRLSIPFLVIAMTYYIGLGVFGRLMPQLPVFFFGLPIQLTIQIGALAIVFSSIMLAFLQYFRDGFSVFIGG